MDYSYYSPQQPQFQYSGAGPDVQTLYSTQDTPIGGADAELFRGLNSIGSSYDAFGHYTPANEFGLQAQQNSFPPRHDSIRSDQHSLHHPKSLSRESSHDGTTGPHSNSDRPRPRPGKGTLAGHDQSDQGMPDLGRSDSEEKDPNSLPALDKRKAQNRAAQRAFRERKERHVKELEAKLATLADSSNSLQSDNERLRRELAALSTQNEILRATHVAPRSSAPSQTSFSPRGFDAPRAPSPTMGPQSFTPTEFIIATGSQLRAPVKFGTYPNQRGKMLQAGAAWDVIARDPRVLEGRVDIEEVCQKLKGKAICDGRGPAFREDELRQVLDECTTGDDDLL